jgi:hypothetical protein
LRLNLPELNHADGSERGVSRYRMKKVQRGMFASAVPSTADIHQSDSQVSFVPAGDMAPLFLTTEKVHHLR